MRSTPAPRRCSARTLTGGLFGFATAVAATACAGDPAVATLDGCGAADLYFASDELAAGSFQLERLHGDGVTSVTQNPDLWSINPAVSPDGRTVAFERSSYGEASYVVVLDVAALGAATPPEASLSRVGPSDQLCASPTWSPDGQWLAIVCAPASNGLASGPARVHFLQRHPGGVFVDQSQSTPPALDGSDPGLAVIAWHPSGAYMAFIAADHAIHWAPLEVGADAAGFRQDPAQVTSLVVGDGQPIGFASLAWSPGGDRLAAVSLDPANPYLFKVRLEAGQLVALDEPGAIEVLATPQTENAVAFGPGGDAIVLSINQAQTGYDYELHTLAIDAIGAPGARTRKIFDGTSVNSSTDASYTPKPRPGNQVTPAYGPCPADGA